MLVRKMLISSGCAATVAVALFACESNRSSSTTSTPEPKTTAAPQTTVTNTNATVPTSGDVLANVSNRSRVTEPADEAKILPPKAVKIPAGFTVPLRSGPRGEWIGSLSTSANVSEVARDPTGSYFLVLYPDPDDSAKQLAGWVFKDAVENTTWSSQDTALGPQAPHAAASGGKEAKLACGKGESHMKTDRDFCAKPCGDDAACAGSKSETCDGLAFEVRDGATRMQTARYCVSAGAPPAGATIN